jgi:hypothetical protein
MDSVSEIMWFNLLFKKEKKWGKEPEHIRFICNVPNSNLYIVLTYNESIVHYEKKHSIIETKLNTVTSFYALLCIKVRLKKQICNIDSQHTKC